LISNTRLEEVAALKDQIGWSWQMVQQRLDWPSHILTQIKNLKRPISESHLQYLRDVAAAVTAIPVPAPEPRSVEIENLKVMLLDDIAAKLVTEYFSPDLETASPDECAGARWMLGRIAERCGVADEVREAIAARQPHQPIKIPFIEQHGPSAWPEAATQ
jgi:hypothetical protein